MLLYASAHVFESEYISDDCTSFWWISMCGVERYPTWHLSWTMIMLSIRYADIIERINDNRHFFFAREEWLPSSFVSFAKQHHLQTVQQQPQKKIKETNKQICQMRLALARYMEGHKLLRYQVCAAIHSCRRYGSWCGTVCRLSVWNGHAWDRAACAPNKNHMV